MSLLKDIHAMVAYIITNPAVAAAYTDQLQKQLDFRRCISIAEGTEIIELLKNAEVFSEAQLSLLKKTVDSKVLVAQEKKSLACRALQSMVGSAIHYTTPSLRESMASESTTSFLETRMISHWAALGVRMPDEAFVHQIFCQMLFLADSAEELPNGMQMLKQFRQFKDHLRASLKTANSPPRFIAVSDSLQTHFSNVWLKWNLCVCVAY